MTVACRGLFPGNFPKNHNIDKHPVKGYSQGTFSLNHYSMLFTPCTQKLMFHLGWIVLTATSVLTTRSEGDPPVCYN